jgi:hypothetical protein
VSAASKPAPQGVAAQADFEQAAAACEKSGLAPSLARISCAFGRFHAYSVFRGHHKAARPFLDRHRREEATYPLEKRSPTWIAQADKNNPAMRPRPKLADIGEIEILRHQKAASVLSRHSLFDDGVDIVSEGGSTRVRPWGRFSSSLIFMPRQERQGQAGLPRLRPLRRRSQHERLLR